MPVKDCRILWQSIAENPKFPMKMVPNARVAYGAISAVNSSIRVKTAL